MIFVAGDLFDTALVAVAVVGDLAGMVAVDALVVAVGDLAGMVAVDALVVAVGDLDDNLSLALAVDHRAAAETAVGVVAAAAAVAAAAVAAAAAAAAVVPIQLCEDLSNLSSS